MINNHITFLTKLMIHEVMIMTLHVCMHVADMWAFSKYLSKNGQDMSSTFFQKVLIISFFLSFNQLKTCI